MEELRVARILSQLVCLYHESRGSVCSVVEDAFEVCPVRDAAVCLGLRVCILKLRKVLEDLLRNVELSCNKACARH